MSAQILRELICPIFDDNVVVDIFKQLTGFKQVIVKNIKVSDSTTNKGDSYLSVIIRFTIEGTVREGQGDGKEVICPVIVKALPKNIARRKSFRSTDFFRNEVIFYNEVWDTLLKFQDTKNIKNKFNNIPKCLAVSDGENDFIALEDLSAQSYVPFKRQGEMDYDSVIMIIRLFARFHALSFAFKDQFPKEFEHLAEIIEETYFDDKFRNWYNKFQSALIACTRDAIEKELPASYLKKYDNVVGNDLYGQLIKLAQNAKGKFSLITQGDAWIPNFLIKYGADNKPEDVKLIDFQLARCNSLSCDLSLFLYACGSYELLNKRWDDIMMEYHKTFTKSLVDLGSDPAIFTLEDLKADMKGNALFGMSMAMEAVPFQMMDDEDTADLDSIQGEEAVNVSTIWRVHPVKHKEGRQKLANIWKHAIDREFI